MELYLIRHGQSLAQADPSLEPDHKDSDPGLSLLGIEQAQHLGDCVDRTPFLRLSTCEIWTSTMKRASETAATFVACQRRSLFETETPDITILSDDRLRELWQPGLHNIDEGRIEIDHPAYLRTLPDFRVRGGETHREVRARAAAWLDQTMDGLLAEGSDKTNLLVFTHGHIIRCLLWNILGFSPHMLSKILLENTSVTKLEWSHKRGWLLHYVGNEPHYLM